MRVAHPVTAAAPSELEVSFKERRNLVRAEALRAHDGMRPDKLEGYLGQRHHSAIPSFEPFAAQAPKSSVRGRAKVPRFNKVGIPLDAPTGPTTSSLRSQALQLRQHPSVSLAWELHGKTKRLLYADPDGSVAELEAWWCGFVRPRLTMTDQLTPENSGPAPLIISGTIKSGKTYTQQVLIPAIIAKNLVEEEERWQQQQAQQQNQQEVAQPEPAQQESQAQAKSQQREEQYTNVQGIPGIEDVALLAINGGRLVTRMGSVAFLQSLLDVLLEWAADHNVPVEQRAWFKALKASTAKVSWHNCMLAVLAFISGIKTPVVVLIDELQAMLNITTKDGTADPAAETLRDVMWKTLLTRTPTNVVFVLTGSSMALTWMTLAAMPPNGTSVFATCKRIDLPTAYSDDLMALTWQTLKDQSAPSVASPDELLKLCLKTTPAYLTMFVEYYRIGHETPLAALSSFTNIKLVAESRQEWANAIQLMKPEERVALFDLSSIDKGCSPTRLAPGVLQFLRPHLESFVTGKDRRFRLADSYQRQLLKLVLQPNGELITSWADNTRFSVTLRELEAFKVFVKFGETVGYLAKTKRQYDPPPQQMDIFKLQLEELAAEVDQLIPFKKWPEQAWFQRVLNSKWNDADKSQFTRSGREHWSASSASAMLSFYHRMVRNVFTHTKPWLVEISLQDSVYQDLEAEVINAVPELLGVSLDKYTKRLADMLSTLDVPDEVLNL